MRMERLLRDLRVYTNVSTGRHEPAAKIDSSELAQFVKTRQMMSDLGYIIETGPIVMYFLTRRMSDKDTAEIQRMIPRRDFVDKWKHLESGAHELGKRLTSKEAGMPSGAWKILTQATPENILFLDLTTRQQAIDQKLKNFFGKWRQVKEKLPFPEMAELRITAQLPEYPEIMEKAFLLLLDGKLRSHTEITNFLKPYEPPPPPPPPAPKRGRGKAAAGVGEAPAPAKRGRKPKGTTPPAPPVEAPAAAPEAPAPARKAAPAAPEKPSAATQVAGRGKTPKKKAVPSKIAKKAAPAKAKTVKKAPSAGKAVGKKTAAKKPAAKKTAAKKSARKR